MSLTDVDHPTRWKKGQSGNPSGLPGKPVGARTAFSQGFLKDLAESWRDSVRGRKAMDWTAEHQPATYFAVCSRLIGPEVKVTIEQSLPGNLSPSDWAVRPCPLNWSSIQNGLLKRASAQNVTNCS
jgi:hypothetical protein